MDLGDLRSCKEEDFPIVSHLIKLSMQTAKNNSASNMCMTISISLVLIIVAVI